MSLETDPMPQHPKPAEAKPKSGEATRLLTEARRELTRLPLWLPALVDSLDERSWRARPAPGRWSPLEIVCHLRDEEQEDFGARLRVVLAGQKEFAPIDPEGWIAARRYGEDDPRRALASLEARRRENLDLLGRIEADKLEAKGMSGSFELSGLDILAAWVAHDLLHLRQLAGTQARLWATRWASLQCPYAGQLPYPPGESQT